MGISLGVGSPSDCGEACATSCAASREKGESAMREEATAVTAPQVMTTPEASAYIAGKPAGTVLRTEEFLRFAERFGLEPIDKVGGGSRVRGETCIRYKWSKRHIDLVLMTGMKFRDALKWAQGAKLILS